jgi:SET domain
LKSPPAGLEIRPTRNGEGLFAARPYRTGQRIIRIAGKIVAARMVTRRGGAFADNCFRFGPETYLDPGDEAGAYLNHSCEPNACVRKSNNKLFLVAIETIRPHDEIVVDYSTILGDDDIWTMRCNCGSTGCRKVIRRFGSLPAQLKQGYAERGAVPGYILDTLS